MTDVHGLHARPKFDSGNTRADMAAVLTFNPPGNTVQRERITMHFVAYDASNAAFGMAWRNQVMEPPRRELKRLLMSGILKKELSPDLDLDQSLALLLGPLIYWKVLMKKTSEDPRPLADAVLDAFWKAFGLTRTLPKVSPRARMKSY